MKLKLLLFFLVVLGFSAIVKAQTTKPYTNLVITEALTTSSPDNYVEFTNMGSEPIDLSQFEFGHIGAWDLPWNPPANNYFMLPEKTLAPGKSYVISLYYAFSPKMWKIDPLHYSERITKPEMLILADQLLYYRENNITAADSVTPYYSTMDGWNGRETWYLRHHFINTETGEKDSVVIDQVGGVFDEEGGSNYDRPYDVAGVTNATGNSVLIRKASVKTGNVDFATGRGLDAADSEWIPVPYLSIYQWRAVFWTVGNQAVGAKLDNNTLVSKSGKEVVDIVNGTITVPWGVRRKDSIMYRFERRPGLAWAYDVVANREDSAFVSSRTGDKLTLYVCGDEPTIKEFIITVQAPTPSDNIVIPKCGMNFANMAYSGTSSAYGGWQVTDGVPVMDTISRVGYATRIDTLFKYLEKPPKASWKIKFVDNNENRPDLKFGDILQVTSENGKLKEYFLKLAKFVPSDNAYLNSITWPDMPAYFRGAVAKSYGWAGDTIPGFNYSNSTYIVKIPMEYDGIPALVYTKRDLNSKVTVARAKTLSGTVADRTVTFTVTAENDTTIRVYTVRFDKEKDASKVQPWNGEPFFSQIVFQESWGKPWVEIVNPGTEILDLSNYMIFCNGGSGLAAAFAENNTAETPYDQAYHKYVPGKKWQDEGSWAVQPRILEPDFAVNPMVYPGDVFVMTQNDGGDSWRIYGKEVDVNFATGMNPWGFNMNWGNAIHGWTNLNYYLYKITNDSITRGIKPTFDINDFELVDMFGKSDGGNISVGGETMNQLTGYWRKPSIYKGNTELGGSLGTDWDNSEWTMKNDAWYWANGYGWPNVIFQMVDGIGAHVMDEVTMYRSTVSSKVLKVSEGYGMNETIHGVKTGTTVAGFYADLIKAHEDQSLKVKSASTGAFLTEASVLSDGDMLVVLSADGTNTSQYTLNVSSGLSSNAVLTPASAKYTVNVTGATGTVGGFNVGALLKDVYAGVIVPAGATLTITDANDAYMSLQKLRFDTIYANVVATDQIYFEVIAENGINKILYQLTPTVDPSEAKITSDVYSVDQFASLIQFIPAGTTVTTLKSNVYPSTGATVVIYDKKGNVRSGGDIYRDDKLVVTSSDGNTVKTYYFAMLTTSKAGTVYLAYVISEDYDVNQLSMTITGPVTPSVSEFFNKLYPSFGANLSVVDKDGNANTTGTFKKGDKLLVTAADGMTTATYNISMITKAIDVTAETIKMYPNPTDGRVIVQGLEKGNRVRVINAAGVTLRDVIVNNSTEYVSLAAQPAGIYVFVVSNGDKFINIQKIVKK
jgi:hypothetical protein